MWTCEKLGLSGKADLEDSRQLVRTGGAFAVTFYSGKTLYYFIGMHAFNKCSYTFGIAITATRIFSVCDDVIGEPYFYVGGADLVACSSYDVSYISDQVIGDDLVIVSGHVGSHKEYNVNICSKMG